jgi:hypothetical protein
MKTRYNLIPAALVALLVACEAGKLDIDAPAVNVNGGPLLESLTPTSARVQVIVSQREGVKEVGLLHGLQTDRAALVTYGETIAAAGGETEYLFDILDREPATRYSYVAYARLDDDEIAYSVVRSFTTIAAELVVTPSRLSLAAPASTSTLDVATTFDAWDVITGSETWLACRAEGPSLIVTTGDNLTAARRVATLKFTAGSRTLNLAVTQDPPLLSLSRENVTLPPAGGEDSFTVSSNVTAWGASSDAGWLAFSVDGNVVTFQATDSAGVEREGHITVTIGADAVVKVFTVFQ